MITSLSLPALKEGIYEHLARSVSEVENEENACWLSFASNHFAFQRHAIRRTVSRACSRSPDRDRATGTGPRLLRAPNQAHWSAVQPFNDRGRASGRSRRQCRIGGTGNACF